MNCKKYVAPAIEIITMQTEGMIAGSAQMGTLQLVLVTLQLVPVRATWVSQNRHPLK